MDNSVQAQASKAERFLALHRSEHPLLLPNPWDVGSAKLLESLGYLALATTSSGHAATLGRLDGGVTREEAIAHAASIAEATDLPVSADLENCFADDADGVANTIRSAIEVGLAGCSVEDHTRRSADPIYDIDHARERVTAAAEAAHAGPVHLVLTARAENYLHGRQDLGDTITRLQAFQEAGADVLYAPGVTKAEDIRQIVEAVDLPVNVLAIQGVPPVSVLGAMGVARVSVGGAFNLVGIGATVEAATELLRQGTYGYLEKAKSGIGPRSEAFGNSDL